MSGFTFVRSASVAFLLCGCLFISSNSVRAVEHVIHISFDGLRGDLLESYMMASPSTHPSFMRFVEEGATTFNARADYTNTETLPNHTSMLTGRPVDQPSGAPNTTHHGYTGNGVPSPTTTLHNSGNPNLSYVASTFDVVHDNGLSTALYASEGKFSLFEQSYTDTTGAVDVTGPDDGRDKIDSDFIVSNFGLMHVTYLSDMAANQYNYSFLHYDDLDGIGHSAGWESPTWKGTVEFMDGFVGELFDLIETTPGLAGNTAIVLTADHGGTGTSHGDPTLAANYTIPVFVWGPGVAPNADLYELNPYSRLDPGGGRPGYTSSVQPIRNGDTGNLALALLGLGPVDGSFINAGQDLAVASAFAADFDANQRVDADDFAIWQAGYGSSPGASQAHGDANQDGRVDGRDFMLWQRENGSELPIAVTAIPEPGGILLILMVIVCLCSTRR